MYSQVIYGSCARKDNDVLSDKDMGIFFNDTRDISESLKKYTATVGHAQHIHMKNL